MNDNNKNNNIIKAGILNPRMRSLKESERELPPKKEEKKVK